MATGVNLSALFDNPPQGAGAVAPAAPSVNRTGVNLDNLFYKDNEEAGQEVRRGIAPPPQTVQPTAPIEPARSQTRILDLGTNYTYNGVKLEEEKPKEPGLNLVDSAAKGVKAVKLTWDYLANRLENAVTGSDRDTGEILARSAAEYKAMESDPRIAEMVKKGDAAESTPAAVYDMLSFAVRNPTMVANFVAEQAPSMLAGGGIGAVVTAPVRAGAVGLASRAGANAAVQSAVGSGVTGASMASSAVVLQSLGSNYAEGLDKFQGDKQAASDYAVTKTANEVPANAVAGAFLGFNPFASKISNIALQANIQGAGGATGAYMASKSVGEDPSRGEMLLEYLGEAASAPVDIAVDKLSKGKSDVPGTNPPPATNERPVAPPGASQDVGADIQPQGLQVIPRKELLATLKDMDAVAYLYSTGDKEQKKSIEAAIDRAGTDYRQAFDATVGREQNIMAGEAKLAQEPLFVDSLRNAIDVFGKTLNLSSTAKVAKKPAVEPAAIDDPDFVANQDAEAERILADAERRKNQAKPAPLNLPEGVKFADLSAQEKVKALGTEAPGADWTKEKPSQYGVVAYSAPASQSSDVTPRVYSHPALPGIFYDSERKLFDALKIRKDAKEKGQWTAQPRPAESTSKVISVSKAATQIQEAADMAATSPNNDLPEPTEGQKKAGNYAKGHTTLQGIDITIENPRDSTRSGTSPDGTSWSNKMAHHYGYIKGSVGADKDHVDTFIGENPDSKKAFVIDQVNPDGSFDEHKVMLGFNTAEEARAGYLANYAKGWQGLGAMTEMPVEALKSWVKDGKKKQPLGELEAKPQTEVDKAKQDLKDAAYDLWDVASDAAGTKMNITGKRYTVADLPKALQKVMEALVKLGYVQFKDMSAELMKRMRANDNWKDLADKVSPAMLRQAYNSLPAFEGKQSTEEVAAVTRDDLKSAIGSGEFRAKFDKDGRVTNATGRSENADTVEKVDVPAKPVETKAKTPQVQTVTREIQSRIEKLDLGKERTQALDLLRQGKYDEAEAVVDKFYKKQAAAKKADLLSARRKAETLAKWKNAFKISEAILTNFQNRTNASRKRDGMDPLIVVPDFKAEIDALLSGDTTQMNVERANDLLKYQASIIARMLIRAGKVKAGTKLFEKMDLGMDQVISTMQAIRAGADVSPGEISGGKVQDKRPSIPNERLGQYPSLMRRVSEMRAKLGMLESSSDAKETDVKAAKGDLIDMLKYLGSLDNKALKDLNETWENLYKAEDGEKQAQMRLDLGENERTERQLKLDTRFKKIINDVTGATLLKQGLADLREKIARLDTLIAQEDRPYRPDELRGLFGTFDDNAYARDEEGFRGDRANTTRDDLVYERSRLSQELSTATKDNTKGKAKRLEKGLEGLRDRMIAAGQSAVAGGMSFEDVAQVMGKYLQDLGFVQSGMMSNVSQEVEEKFTQADRDIAESQTLDLFEENKAIEQLAAGELSAQEAAKVAGQLDAKTAMVEAMNVIARQIKDLGKTGFEAEYNAKLKQVSGWIAQNMRANTLLFSQVQDAFRGNGIDLPIELVNNTMVAMHTPMLEYAKQQGGGYAPREFWLRSMDQAIQFNPDVQTDGTFSDAELAMYDEWKSRQQELGDRRNTARVEEADSMSEAFRGMLFMKHPLASMKNPRLIADERERLALTNTIPDLVDAWHRDLEIALQKRQDMFHRLTDAEEGVVLPTDYQAHLEWRDRKAKADEVKAAMIARSQYHLAIPQYDGLSDEQLESLKLQIAQSDVASLDTVLDTANQMALANRFGEGTTVDPETGEIVSAAELARAQIVDDMIARDQSIDAVAESFGTRDKKKLSPIFQAMDAGIDDVTTAEGSFARLASESSAGEFMPDVEDLDSYEAQQDAAENTDSEGELRFKHGFFSGLLTNTQVQSVVSRLTQNWKSAPQIVVLKNVAQLPDGLRERVMEKLSGDMGARGLFDTGSGVTYLFSDMMRGDADVEFVLYHEVYGHLGMRAFLGAKFDATLNSLYNNYPSIKTKVDAMVEAGRPKLEAIDEVLADMAGNNKEAGAVKLWIGKMIDGLRELGFTRIADWMSTLTGADLAFYLDGARKAAQNNEYKVMDGAPGDVRLSESMHDRLYEMFATKDGKTTAYARFNPITQSWAVFTATGADIRDGHAAGVQEKYEDTLKFMRMKGKVEFRKRSGAYIEDKMPSDLATLSEAANLGDGAKGAVKRWMRSLITRHQNEFRPVFDLVEYIGRNGILTPRMDVKLALTNYERRTAEIIRSFGQTYVRPIEQLAKEAGELGADYGTINTFLLARHAPSRNAQIARINEKMPDKGSGMYTEDAKAFLESIQDEPYFEKLQEIGMYFDRMSDYKLSYQVKTGMITERQAEKMASVYEHYVNLSGQKDKLDQFDIGQLVGTRFNVKGKEARAFGRSEPASDIMANTILGMEAALIRGQKNIVAQRLLNFLEANYDPNFVAINAIEYKRVLGEDGMVVEVEDPEYIRRKDVMVAKVNGIPVTMQFKDTSPGSFAEAIHGSVFPTQSGDVMETMGKFNQLVGRMLTTLNPAWVPVNFARDAQAMYLNAASDGKITKEQAAEMFKLLPTAIKTAYYMDRAENGKEPDYQVDPELIRVYREMRQAGGMTSFLNRKGLEETVADLNGLLGEAGKLQDFKQKTRAVVDWIEHWTIPMEVAPRLAAYKVAREGGMSKEDAAAFAGDITVNFNMRGNLKFMRQAFLFYNPAVQGIAKMGSLFFELKPDYSVRIKTESAAWKFAGGLMVLGMMTNLIARAIGEDDEAGRNELDKIPTYKRATSIVLAPNVPGGAIPLPYGWNAFFAAGHFLMDGVLGIQSAGTTAKRIFMATLDAFSPIQNSGLESKTVAGGVLKTISPTFALPVTELAINENRYGGPIFKENAIFGGAELPNSERGFRSTSPISTSIAKGLNQFGGNTLRSGYIDLNPAIMDHLIGSYLPGAINETYKAAGLGVRAARGEEVKNTPLPLIDRLTAKVPETYDASAFRRASTLINTRYKEYEQYPERREEIRKEIPGLLRAYAIVASTTQEIRKLEADQKLIESPLSKQTDEYKIQRLNRMRETEKRLYARAVKAVMESGGELKDALMSSN